MECRLIKETQLSSEFVDDTIREFGSSIWIYKQPPIIRGTPDIFSMVNGMFIPIECKKVERESGNSILSHPFMKIQKKRMRDFMTVLAYPIGLIFHERGNRYILPLAIREDGNISMEEFLKLPIFNWMEVSNAATESYLSRCSKR
jgi:hypothetical protein